MARQHTEINPPLSRKNMDFLRFMIASRVDVGASVHTLDKNARETPLFMAAGADIDHRNCRRATAICEAVCNSDLSDERMMGVLEVFIANAACLRGMIGGANWCAAARTSMR